jgi:hypothetical protein
MLKVKTLCGVAVSVALIGGGWIYAQSGKAQKLTAMDYSEIQELYANYTQALDLNQPENLAATFTADGELVSSKGPGEAKAVRTSTRGHDALVRMEQSHGNFGSRHLTSDLVLKQTADGVKATCYLVDINVSHDPATLIETGVFDAVVVKTTSGWKFKKLVVWRDNDDITPFKATKKQ